MRFQFQGYAVPTILCGWNPWDSDPQTSADETTVASYSKSKKVSPEEP